MKKRVLLIPGVAIAAVAGAKARQVARMSPRVGRRRAKSDFDPRTAGRVASNTADKPTRVDDSGSDFSPDAAQRKRSSQPVTYAQHPPPHPPSSEERTLAELERQRDRLPEGPNDDREAEL
jgi:hypothetical protein